MSKVCYLLKNVSVADNPPPWSRLLLISINNCGNMEKFEDKQTAINSIKKSGFELRLTWQSWTVPKIMFKVSNTVR